ncbi:hypothetical protein P0949_22265, partial [Xanthomonas hortorum pv. gardneri]
ALQQTHSVKVAARTPHPTVCWLFIEIMRTDHLRWWAGKGPAAKPQISCSATDLSALSNQVR